MSRPHRNPIPISCPTLYPSIGTSVIYPTATASTNALLSVNEFRRMAQAQGKPMAMLRHQIIARRGPPTDMVWIVAHGWALTRGDRAAGRSPILRLYLPGEIIGLTELGLGLQPHDVEMLTEGLLHAVPRSAIASLARQHARFWLRWAGRGAGDHRPRGTC